MAMPKAWVDEIFARLTVRYGSAFLNRWLSVGVDLELVKADWATELAGMKPEGIGYALKHLPPDRPPTVGEFRVLANQAPPPVFKALPQPAPSDEQRQKVRQMLSTLTQRMREPREPRRAVQAGEGS